ncbi:hypothetical protein F4677DRAFT_436769 [Hypoxylon crocopeplum]|nr:hypothetical protein F4677DRAFT_436769 [Hypoxylon crocopeplum]
MHRARPAPPRVCFLQGQLQTRIMNLTEVQRRIPQDVHLFINGDEQVWWNFEGTRQRYLDLLNISVLQLREAMNTSDLSENSQVEYIQNRVKPVTRGYLQRLVREHEITQDDMDCILAGGYDSVEDFFRDMSANVGPFGLPLDPDLPSGSSDSSDSGATHPDQYDENGFLIAAAQDKEIAPMASPPANEAGSRPLPEIAPSIRLVSPSEPLPWADQGKSLSWADQVELELEMAASLTLPASPTSNLSSTDDQISPPASEDAHNSSDDASSSNDTAEQQNSEDSEDDTSSSNDAAEQQNDEVSAEAHDHPSSEHVENVVIAHGSTTTLALRPAPHPAPALASAPSPAPAPAPAPEPVIDWLHVNRAAGISDNLDQPTDRDEVTNIWLEDQGMWFWQYEAIFAALLTEQRFKTQFQDARRAYIVSPFNDND